MELIRGLHNLRPHHHGSVVTIGNFDGVHLGHQAVLGQLAERADRLGLPTVVVIFEPQPQEFFGAAPLPRLTRLREKLQALRRFSVNRVLCLRFDRSFAALTAEQFIDRVLRQGLGVRYLVVGDDFRFGADRLGNYALLQQAGRDHDFEVTHTRTFTISGERVSSTRIRRALATGDLALAEQLLGRCYRMSGRVAHGDKRGRTIGFPTANIHLHRQQTPLDGVFAVQLHGIGAEPLPGVANIGRRPTVNGSEVRLEVHLFDFSGDIYGRYVTVDFLQRIRPEQRFESFAALREQIVHDAATARRFFGMAA